MNARPEILERNGRLELKVSLDPKNLSKKGIMVGLVFEIKQLIFMKTT